AKHLGEHPAAFYLSGPVSRSPQHNEMVCLLARLAEGSAIRKQPGKAEVAHGREVPKPLVRYIDLLEDSLGVLECSEQPAVHSTAHPRDCDVPPMADRFSDPQSGHGVLERTPWILSRIAIPAGADDVPRQRCQRLLVPCGIGDLLEPFRQRVRVLMAAGE